MEIWDVYDKAGKLTGRSHIRGNKMKPGEFHLVVHVWIVNKSGEFLIQKRSLQKEGYPGMWHASAAGSAVKGDNSLEAAIRETKEEIGVDISKSSPVMIHSFTKRPCIYDVWLVKMDVPENEIVLQTEEVSDSKWARREEIEKMIKEERFIDFGYGELLYDSII